MGLMGCLGCDFKYVIGLLRCPRCQTRSPLHPPAEGETEVAKISVNDGPSNADDTTSAQNVEEPEAAPVVAPVEEDPAPPSAEMTDAPPVQVGETITVPADGSPSETGGASNLPVEGEPAVEQVVEQTPDSAVHVSAADAAAGYTDLSFAQLRTEAKARGLAAGGSAVELAARLADHDTAVQAAPETPAPAPAPQEASAAGGGVESGA